MLRSSHAEANLPNGAFLFVGRRVGFFQFALHIPAVQKLEGEGDLLMIHVRSKPGEQDLRDLIGLFERYEISNASQLARFRTSANEGWFADPEMYWHEKIFGGPKTGQGTKARFTG